MIFKQIRYNIVLKTRQPMEPGILVFNFFPDWVCSVRRSYRTVINKGNK